MVKPEIQEPLAGYLFAYFKGDTLQGEKIYFALSEGNNALVWKNLNSGLPVISSELGTGGLRDPFIIRSKFDGKYYLLATDLSIGGGTSWEEAVTAGSRSIAIFESEDLATWSSTGLFPLAPKSAYNAWAPKAVLDEETQAYLVFWSSIVRDDSISNPYQQVFFSRTRDFRNFSDPGAWISAGDSVIDLSILKSDGVWHRFSKSEPLRTGCSDVLHEISTDSGSLVGSRNWEVFDTCISNRLGMQPVEGPIVFRANPGDSSGAAFFLFLDRYTAGGYFPLISKDLNSKTWVPPSESSLPEGARHGCVIPITQSQLDGLENSFS